MNSQPGLGAHPGGHARAASTGLWNVDVNWSTNTTTVEELSDNLEFVSLWGEDGGEPSATLARRSVPFTVLVMPTYRIRKFALLPLARFVRKWISGLKFRAGKICGR